MSGKRGGWRRFWTQCPNEKPSKIVQILANMWKNESDAVKKQYQDDFNVRNEKYLAEKAKLIE